MKKIKLRPQKNVEKTELLQLKIPWVYPYNVCNFPNPGICDAEIRPNADILQKCLMVQ